MTTNKNKEKNFGMDTHQKQQKSYIMDFNRMRSKNYHHNVLVDNCVKPYFEKLEEYLISYIEKATFVVGCVAWLTNRNIIEALENIKGVKIIINKEEYLNSNMEIGQKFFYKCLRGKYNEIPDMFNINCLCCTESMPKCINFNKIFSCVIDNVDKNENVTDNIKNGAILTCGIVNNFSKMHHKFLIFFNNKIEPTGVWTGSYNLSKTSNFSLENALYITDQYVIMEYIKEFLAIYPFSESYNWKSGVLNASIN